MSVTSEERSTAPRGACEKTAAPWSPRAFDGWETLFALALAVSALFVAVGGDHTLRSRVVALFLLAVCAVAYVLLGRPAIIEDRYDSHRALLYAALLVMAFGPASVLVHEASFALFALCPQMFILLRHRGAVLMALVLNLVPGVRYLVEPAESLTELLGFAGVAGLSIAFSLVFGPWVRNIIRLSTAQATMIEELEASRAEITRLSAERGALAERERLAGEIHDTLAQGFTSIIMLVQAAQANPDPARHLALAVQTARENLAEARALIAALHPAELHGSTLDEALKRVADRLGEELGIPIAFTSSGASRPLPPGTEVVLIRAAQEALANVRKHAGASAVSVSIEYGPADVRLAVSDDGIGFEAGAATTGYGLRAMANRIEQLGGVFTVTSAPRALHADGVQGTILSVILPVAPMGGPR
jgi:signal transduction histidine kinase